MEWLARFPMTRAVVRAMDVIQEITSSKENAVKKFFISGASKRGWTTWTTAAVDNRVMGMAPLVIDLLNLVPSFDHHYKVYGDWSPAVNDYVEFQIMDWMNTKEFKKLMNYVEPYQFKELFTMPKLIVNGTIDEFFVTDSWKFYWEDIPDKKYLQYVPNGNHGLTEGYRYQNVFSFYDRLIHSRDLPQMEWNIEKDVFHLDLGIDTPYNISLWKINNPNSRDFRIWEVGRNWKKIMIKNNKSGKYKIIAPIDEGFTASLVEVVFYPDSEAPITLTTGTQVLPNKYSFSSYGSKIKTKDKIKKTPVTVLGSVKKVGKKHENNYVLNSIFQISLTSLRSFIEGSESTVAVRNVNQLIPIAKTTTTHAKVHKDFLRLLVVTAIISATYSVHCTPYRITCLRKIVTNSDQNNEKKELNYLYSIFAVFHLYFGLYTNRMCISNT